MKLHVLNRALASMSSVDPVAIVELDQLLVKILTGLVETADWYKPQPVSYMVKYDEAQRYWFIEEVLPRGKDRFNIGRDVYRSLLSSYVEHLSLMHSGHDESEIEHLTYMLLDSITLDLLDPGYNPYTEPENMARAGVAAGRYIHLMVKSVEANLEEFIARCAIARSTVVRRYEPSHPALHNAFWTKEDACRALTGMLGETNHD